MSEFLVSLPLLDNQKSKQMSAIVGKRLKFSRIRQYRAAPDIRVGLTIAGVAVLLSGCAVQYYDSETGTAHIWGFGHMSMKVSPPNQGLQAVVQGTRVLGLSLGKARDRTYLTIGYDSHQQTDILDRNTSVHLEWPAGDLFRLRAGSSWPNSDQTRAASVEPLPNNDTLREENDE